LPVIEETLRPEELDELPLPGFPGFGEGIGWQGIGLYQNDAALQLLPGACGELAQAIPEQIDERRTIEVAPVDAFKSFAVIPEIEDLRQANVRLHHPVVLRVDIVRMRGDGQRRLQQPHHRGDLVEMVDGPVSIRSEGDAGTPGDRVDVRVLERLSRGIHKQKVLPVRALEQTDDAAECGLCIKIEGRQRVHRDPASLDPPVLPYARS